MDPSAPDQSNPNSNNNSVPVTQPSSSPEIPISNPPITLSQPMPAEPTTMPQPSSDSSSLWEKNTHNPFPPQPAPNFPPVSPTTPTLGEGPMVHKEPASTGSTTTSPSIPTPPVTQNMPVSAPAGGLPPIQSQPPSSVFNDTPSVYNDNTKSGSGGHKGVKVLIIVLAVFLVGILGAGSAAAAIAYGKLPINNPSITKPITAFVLGLPFTPKTPDYVLETAALAQKNVNKTSFDVSLATNLDQLSGMGLGFSKLDMEAKGAVDYSDTNNIALTLNGSITRDLNFDLREKDHLAYVKVNQIPAVLEPLLQAQYGDLLNTIKQNWISFDLSTLDTAARKQLDSQPTNNSSSADLEALLDKKLISELHLSNSTVDNFPVYKVSLNADDALVDDIGHNLQKQEGDLQYDSSLDKLSSEMKNVQMTWLIDKVHYYVREVDLSFNINYAGSSSSDIPTLQSRVLGADAQSIPVSMVVKLSNFGQAVNVDVPSSPIPAEQLYQQLINEEMKQATTSPVASPLLNKKSTSNQSLQSVQLNSAYSIQKITLPFPLSVLNSILHSLPIH